jgi:hypothetical protein
LEAVKVLAVDGRDELSGEEAQENAGGEVVFPDAVGHLEVLVEHGAEVQRYRLRDVSIGYQRLGKELTLR